MIGISYELIEKLNDEEIYSICKYTDLEIFLVLFRKNTKKYDRFIKLLGRLDKKSQLVQTLLPKFAFDLYKKGDIAFVSAVSMVIEDHKSNFLDAIKLCSMSVKNIEDIKLFQNSDFVKLYFSLVDISNGTFLYDIFLCALKICDVFPGTENMILIKNQIDEIEEKKKQEEQFNNKLESELKKREKQILQKYEHEKELMNKMLKNLESELIQSRNNESTLYDELVKLQQNISTDKERMIAEWKADIEIEINERKKVLLDELISYENKEKCSVEERITTLENDLKDKLDREYSAAKEDADNKIFDLTIEILKLEAHKKELENSISSMETQENICRTTIESLEKAEEDFFSNIKLRVLERKLDKLVFEDNEDNESSHRGKNIYVTSLEQRPMIYEWRSFAENAEESENVAEYFIDDLADNIAINFEHATEIALLIITAILNRKAIIIESSIAQYIVESLSEIIDGSIPLVIEANGANANAVISAIKDSSHKVIFVDGVLNNFDEVMFSSICRQTPEGKYLFFGVSQIKDSRMFSKTTINNALVLDVEKYMVISTNEPIIVGINDLEAFNEPIGTEVCKAYYDKYFKILAEKSIIPKKSAFDISRMLCMYLKYMSSIGEVAKQCVSYYWNDTIDEEMDVNALLERAGWL